MTTNTVLLKIENYIAHIRLNRPEVFNSFNREMALKLQQVLDDCESNSEVRVIVLTGNGKAFRPGQKFLRKQESRVKNPKLNFMNN